MSKAGETRSPQYKLVEKRVPTTLGMAEIVSLKQQQLNYTFLSTSKFTPTLHIPGENLTKNRLASRWETPVVTVQHGLHRAPRSIALSEQSKGQRLSWTDIREEFTRNKQLDFKGNFGKPYISISHGFLLLSNIVTTNLNLLSSTIITGFRLCQHISKSSLWEFLGVYLVLTKDQKLTNITIFTTITYLHNFMGFTLIMGMIHFQKLCGTEKNEF